MRMSDPVYDLAQELHRVLALVRSLQIKRGTNCQADEFLSGELPRKVEEKISVSVAVERLYRFKRSRVVGLYLRRDSTAMKVANKSVEAVPPLHKCVGSSIDALRDAARHLI